MWSRFLGGPVSCSRSRLLPIDDSVTAGSCLRQDTHLVERTGLEPTESQSQAFVGVFLSLFLSVSFRRQRQSLP